MGRPAKDLTGQTFGRLTVLRWTGTAKGGRALWECRCSCGQIRYIVTNSLTSGHSQSCGCFKADRVREMGKGRRTHGKTNSRAFACWKGMRDRCYYPKDDSYKRYGGRGIQVCERWNDAFKNFYADMGDPPPGMSIERINNDGNYEPGNCKWATLKEQMNNRSQNVFFTFRGKTQTMQQWADEYGIHEATLRCRLINLKWPIEKALTMPVRIYRNTKMEEV